MSDTAPKIDRREMAQQLLDDQRPVDLNAIIELLEHDIDNQGEVGIWGGYGPPAAPVSHLVRLILNNAEAIENRGEYLEKWEAKA